MLYGSEMWCLKKSEMAVLIRTEKSIMRAMCGVNLRKGEPRPYEFSRLEEHCRWVCQDEWSMMVWACFKKE